MKSKVIIVGAGAAGMCAAIIAARNGTDVLILEKNQTVGKKLSMTGNGRCNLSHAGIVPEDYNQGARTYLPSLFRQISEKDVRDFLKSIGVLIREEEGGLYPYSGQASSVVEAFQSEIRHLGIRVIDRVQVKQVIPKSQIFSIRTSSTLYEADAVILSCGGMAGPKSTMSSGDGYYMASRLGMKTIPPLPALVRLKSTDADLPKQSGLRIEARVSLTGKQRMIAKLNLFPDYSDQEYHNICEERKTRRRNRQLGELFNGFSHSLLTEMILKRNGVKPEMAAESVSSVSLEKIFQMYRNLEISISATDSFSSAQVTAGGVDLSEVNEHLESKKVPGVFLAGELLDVNGRCGGYNLHFAWVSGMIAGREASNFAAER